jgi:hypothetical protein
VETALAVASSSERERAHDLARNGRVVALIMEYLRITKTWHPLRHGRDNNRLGWLAVGGHRGAHQRYYDSVGDF